MSSQPAITVKEMLFAAHQYILQISRVQDRELFKVCLEYWQKLVSIQGWKNESRAQADSFVGV